MENDRLWGRLVDRHHRILRSETVPIVDGDTEAAFLEICRRFDIQRPIQLRKHAHEYENFNTTFHFVFPAGNRAHFRPRAFPDAHPPAH